MTAQARSRLYWPLQLGGWLAFGAAMSIGRIGEWRLTTIIAADWMYTVLGFCVTLGLGAAYARVNAARSPLRLTVGVSLVGSYLGSLLWTASYHTYLKYLGPGVQSALSGQPATIGYSGPLLDDTVYNSLTLLAWSVLYFGIQYYQAMHQEREAQLQARAGELEALARAREAQLQALRYQINPHFLFNTLNAISTLIVEQRTEEATATLARLSDFLRLTLDKTGTAHVTLAEELAFVRQYLEIEKIRFGSRLRVDFTVDDGALGDSVPSMILQPLVENAIRYAVAPRKDGGTIGIGARHTDQGLDLVVSDDGPGWKASSGDRTGIGLSNTEARLRQLYGRGLTFAQRNGKGLSVHLTIPRDLPTR
jgi:two-component system, LytTR family, sensor kinase